MDRYKRHFAFFLGTLGILLSSPPLLHAGVTEQDLAKEIGEFAMIDDGLYRGAQPSDAGLTLLKDFGIKTIINFRHEEDVVEYEREIVAELGGIDYFNIPWRIQLHPENKPMRQFLDKLETAAKPVFIHCRRGAERTGIADTIYRHYVQKLPREEASKKAMDGFHTKWVWRAFMRKRTDDFFKDLGPTT